MSRSSPGRDFIREIVAADVEAGTHGGLVRTRFPPEPNGFLHIGHAKAICLDFGVAEEFGGTCNLRMDDTNPETEDPRYVEAIERDVRWLGFSWDGPTRYASDCFPHFYDLALQLVRDGHAYVDSLSEEEIRAHRGTVTEPGRPSPHRERPVGENLALLEAMRAGEFPDGAHVLRAKIDLASPNMKLRDPLLYRIRHAAHYRTAEEWPIYPMYDWAHPLSDAIEGVTHSFCTLEFEVNRPLYDWVLDHTRPAAIGLAGSDVPGAWEPRPRQYEFARLNLDHTVMSKRKLAALVREGHVAGWDDPRMPTLAGLRRRGVTPEAIRALCDLVGISRADQRVDVGKLEHAIRDDLNWRAPRVLAVLRPLRLVVESWPEGETEWLDAPHFPPDVGKPGSRKVPFTREILIEREDFLQDPPKGYRRLALGREVRLRHAYVVRCTGVVTDPASGEPAEVRCTHDPESRGGRPADGRRVSGTLHWVSAPESVPCEVRLVDRLFTASDPEAAGEDVRAALNPDSLVVLHDARVEPSVAADPPETRYQFERQGYFTRDPVDSTAERPVFNRAVSLRDTWARRAPETGGEAETAGEEDGAAARDGGAGPEGPAAPSRAGPSERERARAADPALAERHRRWREELDLPEEDADILAGDPETAAFFEEALAADVDPRTVANWVIHEVRGAAGDRSPGELPFGGRAVGELAALIEEGAISQRTAKDVLARMLEEGGDPRRIVEVEGLRRIDDAEALEPVVERLLSRHPEETRRYREGQEALLAFFMGGVMRETGGRADPELAKEVLRERLG